MEFHGSSSSSAMAQSAEETDLRRGPWTIEEDLALVSYITAHGEGRWNSLARCAGLRRTGKSCRLRWLNYLRPDVRRGNITPAEQLLILELHSRWGNRWSKIAQHLPGRTDNEIKNYWRTRVQKHAKQLRCEVNSERFKDVMRHVWMPHLVERIQAAAAAAAADSSGEAYESGTAEASCGRGVEVNLSPENSSAAASSTVDSFPGAGVGGGEHNSGSGDVVQPSEFTGCRPEHSAYADLGSSDFDLSMWENLTGVEDLWLQQQF